MMIRSASNSASRALPAMIMLAAATALPAAGRVIELAPALQPRLECVCPPAPAPTDSAAVDSLKWSLRPDDVISGVYRHAYSLVGGPTVYSGFRRLRPLTIEIPDYKFRMRQNSNYDADRFAGILYAEPILPDDLEEGDEVLSISDNDTIVTADRLLIPIEPEQPQTFAEPWVYGTPEWISVMRRAIDMDLDLQYIHMVENPEAVDYLAWQLPEPPRLPDDKISYSEYLLRQFLPKVDAAEAVLPKQTAGRVYWLHTVGSGLQFSQAYLSSNWYQGGNNYLALLFNFNWDVALNTVYKPNLMFTSSLAYKLAVNSNSKEAVHRYSISQDLLQYNLKAGVKAFKKWFYSFNLQFKTQIFNSYPADSHNLAAAFLSPADLNMGIGMTYNTEARNKTLKLSASISPISYNLKVCSDNRIDASQFNIKPGHHTRSEIGSNAEINLNWDITSNISWKSRLFLFTDYHYFQADWENTLTFNINRFLSTQFYLHPRFDSSAEFGASKWHYWQLKEILSFGLSYTFSTKP